MNIFLPDIYFVGKGLKWFLKLNKEPVLASSIEIKADAGGLTEVRVCVNSDDLTIALRDAKLSLVVFDRDTNQTRVLRDVNFAEDGSG